MTKKDLEERVKSLEQERDIWRDMTSRLLKTLPVQLPPCVAPQVWPYPIPVITPVTPRYPSDIVITTCADQVQMTYPLQIYTN